MIVDAAARLLAAGGSPTVDEVAAAAEVSRRTVYLYFPTFDQLLLDAAVGALSAVDTGPGPTTRTARRGRRPHDDAPARVEALVAAVLAQAPVTLPLGRQIIRLTVDPGPEGPASDPGAGPRRGYRRVHWIETAVESMRDRLDDEQFERLVSALALVIGFEAMVVMRDVRGADSATERRVVGWAARALVDAMSAEIAQPRP